MRNVARRMTQVMLALLVLLSLFLSYNIWFNTKTKISSEPITTTNTVLTDTPAAKMFLPVFCLFHDSTGITWARGSDLIEDVQTEIKNSKFGVAVERACAVDVTINEEIQVDNGIELCYEGLMSLDEYKSIFHLSMNIEKNNLKDVLFRRIVIDFSRGLLYFINDTQPKLIEVAIVMDVVHFKNIRTKMSLQYTPVTENKTGTTTKNRYLVGEKVTLKKYSYILSTQPYTNFRDAFFETDNEVITLDDTDGLSLSGKNNETMSVSEETGNVVYQGTFPVDALQSSTSYYERSYYYVKKLGNMLPQLRYFDENEQTMTFRTYVEGFPLFSKTDKGRVSISFSDSVYQDISIQTNIETIQVPIPQDEEVELQKLEDVLLSCQEGGCEMSKIEQCLIGYSWGQAESSQQVIDLTPVWMIRYKGTWLPQNVLLEQVGKGEI